MVRRKSILGKAGSTSGRFPPVLLLNIFGWGVLRGLLSAGKLSSLPIGGLQPSGVEDSWPEEPPDEWGEGTPPTAPGANDTDECETWPVDLPIDETSLFAKLAVVTPETLEAETLEVETLEAETLEAERLEAETLEAETLAPRTLVADALIASL